MQDSLRKRKIKQKTRKEETKEEQAEEKEKTDEPKKKRNLHCCWRGRRREIHVERKGYRWRLYI